VAAAALIAVGLALGAAPAASAAGTVSITTDCNSDVDLYANVGDTVIITLSDVCAGGETVGGFVYNINGPFPDGYSESGYFGTADVINSAYTWSSSSYSNDWGAYSDGTGTTQVTTSLLASNGASVPLTIGSTVAVTGPNGYIGPFRIIYRGSERMDATPIPPWVQGYGRGGAADACNDGWVASWEQWPHGGTGGWVCTREIPSLG
jgi:hypothetical protein